MKRINLFIGVMLVLSVFTGCESNKQTNSSGSYNSEKSSQTKIETTVEKTTSAPDTQATTIQTEPTTEKPTEPPTEPPTEAPTEKPFSEYRTDITYDQLARTPDDYKNEDLVLRGKVIQVIEGVKSRELRIAINSDYNCVVYALYESKDTPRILDDDLITLYGRSLGLTSYKTVLGSKITLPLIEVKNIENNTSSFDVTTEKDKIEALGQYYINQYRFDHFLIPFINNSDKTMEVSCNITAYDINNNLIGTTSKTVKAIGSGCKSIIYGVSEHSADVARFDYEFSVKQSERYMDVLSNLNYDISYTDSKAIVSITNNGENPAQFLECHTLFFNNGELVDIDKKYIGDSDHEIKKGNTEYKEFTTRNDFNDVQVFFTSYYHS